MSQWAMPRSGARGPDPGNVLNGERHGPRAVDVGFAEDVGFRKASGDRSMPSRGEPWHRCSYEWNAARNPPGQVGKAPSPLVSGSRLATINSQGRDLRRCR